MKKLSYKKNPPVQQFLTLVVLILLSLRISFPSLEKQKNITHILDKNDNLHGLYTQRKEHIEDLLHSTFFDMFDDPIINPKDWEVKRLREIVKVKSGSLLSLEWYVRLEK